MCVNLGERSKARLHCLYFVGRLALAGVLDELK